MTIFIVGIIGIIFLLLTVAVIVNIVLLVIGVIKLRKDKIASIAFISFAILNMMAILIGGYFLIGPKKVSVDTPDGSVKLWSNVIEDYLVNVGNDDLEEVEDMLKEEPKLVYCYDDEDEDIELVKLLHLNGASYSYELYFEYVETTAKEMVDKDDNYEKLLDLVGGE